MMKLAEEMQREIYSIVIAALLLTGCTRRDPEGERRAAVSATFAQVAACQPPVLTGSTDPHLHLALAAVAREAEGMSVRLVGYAIDEAADFDLPVYSMSGGRWLVNEVGRAYLLDEDCRDYKLQGRKAARVIPLNGKIKLQPGEAFEVKLLFPPLAAKVQMGLLIYNGRVLPFSFLPIATP